MLRIYTENRQPANWKQHLWRIEHAINFGPTSATGLTPFEVQFGHKPHELPEQWEPSNVPYVNQYLQQLHEDNAAVQDALMHARTHQLQTASRRRNPKSKLQLGDYAMYRRRDYKPGRVKKLSTIWAGPYKVIHV